MKQSRQPTPLGKMRPNSRAASPHQQQGGAPTEIDRTTVVNLKADVNLVQAEIDARTGQGGILQLQGRMSSLNWSPDPVATLQVVVALQNLLLEKINELARACTVSADEATNGQFSAGGGGKPPMPAPSASTLSKRSKVSSIVAFYHNMERRVDLTSHVNNNVGSLPPTPSGGAGAVGAPAPKLSRSNSNVSAGTGALHNNANIPAALNKMSQNPTPRNSSTPIPNDDDDGVCWTAQAGNNATGAFTASVTSGVSAATSPQLRANSTSFHGDSMSQAGEHHQHPLDSSASHYDQSNHHVSLADAAQAQESIAFLQKKISVFTYLEKYIHELDLVDSSLRAALHPALNLLDIDTVSLGNAVDPNVGKKLSRIKKEMDQQDGFAAAESNAASPMAASGQLGANAQMSNSQFTKTTVSGLASTKSHLMDTATINNAIGEASAEEAGELAQMKHVVAFQSSLLAVLAEKFDSLKVSHVQELKQQDGKIKQLEDALREQVETFERERTFHNTRHERAANLLVLERSRANTPAIGSRPLSRINIKPGTPLPVNQKWKGEHSSLLLTSNVSAGGKPTGSSENLAATTGSVASSSAGAPMGHQPRSASASGQVVLAPLQRRTSDLPLVPTMTRDVAGEAQKEYLRVIANQSDIIKDLTQRSQSNSRPPSTQ